MKTGITISRSLRARFGLRRLPYGVCLLLACGSSMVGAGTSRKAEGVEVMVSAYAVAPPEAFRPKPGQPIYYILNLAQLSLGEGIAGVKMPAPALVEQALVAELAKQGFVRTKVGGPMPGILLAAYWGASNFEVPPEDDLENYVGMVNADGKTPDQVQLEAARTRFKLSGRYEDKPAAETMLGVRQPGVATSPNEEKIISAANEDRLFLFLAAFDAQTFREKKERRLLWRTTMSVDWRNDLAANLPTMLASGGPRFGTNSVEPVFLDERDRRNAEVKIGELQVVPDGNSTPPPVKK